MKMPLLPYLVGYGNTEAVDTALYGRQKIARVIADRFEYRTLQITDDHQEAAEDRYDDQYIFGKSVLQ